MNIVKICRINVSESEKNYHHLADDICHSMKICKLRIKLINVSLCLKSQHCFWLGPELGPVILRDLVQWWPSALTHICATRPLESITTNLFKIYNCDRCCCCFVEIQNFFLEATWNIHEVIGKQAEYNNTCYDICKYVHIVFLTILSSQKSNS